MTHPEQEEILRRALHAVADTIEPGADGLERIRERLSRPHPLIVAWLIAGWTSVAQPALLRMEPAAAGAAGRLSERLGPWLRLVIRSLGTAVERLLGAVKLLQPGSGMSRHEKLRSAMAFGAAAVIGAAGGFALSAGLPQQVISAASSFISPSQTGHPPGGGQNPGPNGSARPYGPTSGASPAGKHKALPSSTPACSHKAKAHAKPTPTVGSSPAPTQSAASPTPSAASPTPSSPSATPTTPTPTQTSGNVNPTPAVNQLTDSDVIVRGARPAATTRPARSPSPSPSCHPAAR